MEQFQGPGACLVVERIIREGTDDASQEKGQSCLFVLERYCERSTPACPVCNALNNPGLKVSGTKNLDPLNIIRPSGLNVKLSF